MAVASPGLVVQPTSSGLVVANGDSVVFNGSGSVPTGLTKTTSYFVVNAQVPSGGNQTYSVSATLNGAAINFTVAGMAGAITCFDTTAGAANLGATFNRKSGATGAVETVRSTGAPLFAIDVSAFLVFSLGGTVANLTSVDIQGSPDNINWTSFLPRAQTAAGVIGVTIASLPQYHRIVITGAAYNTTGTLDVYIVSAG